MALNARANGTQRVRAEGDGAGEGEAIVRRGVSPRGARTLILYSYSYSQMQLQVVSERIDRKEKSRVASPVRPQPL